MKMTIYHVSPHVNRDSILRHGVEPLYSKGKRQTSWLVDQTKLMWAVAHCSARHEVSVNQLDIHIVDTSGKRLMRTAWSGVYETHCRVKSTGVFSAKTFVKEPK